MELSDLAPWGRVLGAVGLYIVMALGTSKLIRRVGSDLKDMQARTSPLVTLIGLVANLAILGLVLLMLVLVDRRPVSDLGLGLGATGTTVARRRRRTECRGGRALPLRVAPRRHRRGPAPHAERPERASTSAARHSMVAVLVAVALQEEVLYRGYVTVNLIHLGWGVVTVASIVLFVGIHLLTNRTSALQLTSWTVGAAVLVLAYLVSGSLWVAVVVHLVMDLLNVVAFDIVGRYSIVTIDPPLRESPRVAYRLGSSALISLLLLGAYGAHIAAPLSS